MDKIKLLITFLIGIIIISLAFNAYQWNTNLSRTKQSNEEIELLLINAEATINAELLRLDRLLSNALQYLTLSIFTYSGNVLFSNF